MTRTDHSRAQFLCCRQGRNPLFDVSITHEIVRAVDASIAGEENSFVRKPCNSITVRVSDTQVKQFDPMLAVVEVQLAREQDGGRFQPACGYIGTRFSGVFPTPRLTV